MNFNLSENSCCLILAAGLVASGAILNQVFLNRDYAKDSLKESMIEKKDVVVKYAKLVECKHVAIIMGITSIGILCGIAHDIKKMTCAFNITAIRNINRSYSGCGDSFTKLRIQFFEKNGLI